MNETAFLETRMADWKRITALCDRAEVTPSKLRPEEFHEFVRLYRRVSADLALVRTRSNNIQLIAFLNDLVGRAYGLLYRSRRKRLGEMIRDAMTTSADTMRRCRWFFFTTVAGFFLSAFFVYFLLDAVPDARAVFVPQDLQSSFEAWKSGDMSERSGEESILMTGMYASNNPRAAVMGGAIAASSFGIGTAYVVYFNGAMVGALAHELAPVGRLPHLLIWLAPHGVTEIQGLLVSAAGGLVMAYATINPGRRRRGEALKAAGQDAIVLLTTGSLMMFIAAPIEGFFSFNPRIPDALKVLFALVFLTLWILFWTRYGRKSPEEAQAAALANG